MSNRKSSFIYVVMIGAERTLVRHTSPGKAVKLAAGPVSVHRAGVEDVANFLGLGHKILDGTKETH